MRSAWVIAAAGAAVMALASIAAAQTPSSPTPGVDTRQRTQERRIEQGVESGALTPREANRLNAREAKIEADKQRALSDGTVTNRERARLHREQDRASRHIYRQKHDRQRRATN